MVMARVEEGQGEGGQREGKWEHMSHVSQRWIGSFN